MGNCLDWPLRTVRDLGLLQIDKLSVSGLRYVEPFRDSVVSVTQNCIVVSNVLGRNYVFLGKGMAKCRQAVRKFCKT
uniref:Uncharacterized protein n=1 Tax=Cyprinodon variegatus TaxID=28743 RepID=A0A3Q2DXN1_CYPVA